MTLTYGKLLAAFIVLRKIGAPVPPAPPYMLKSCARVAIARNMRRIMEACKDSAEEEDRITARQVAAAQTKDEVALAKAVKEKEELRAQEIEVLISKLTVENLNLDVNQISTDDLLALEPICPGLLDDGGATPKA